MLRYFKISVCLNITLLLLKFRYFILIYFKKWELRYMATYCVNFSKYIITSFTSICAKPSKVTLNLPLPPSPLPRKCSGIFKNREACVQSIRMGPRLVTNNSGWMLRGGGGDAGEVSQFWILFFGMVTKMLCSIYPSQVVCLTGNHQCLLPKQAW